MSETNLGSAEYSRHTPLVTIADTGSQLTDVIYWTVVEAGIPAEIVAYNQTDQALDFEAVKANRKAIIYAGSNESVNNDSAPQIPAAWLDGSIPTLGICFGAQASIKALGGKVERHQGEFGRTSITVDPSSVMFKGVSEAVVLMSHGDSIVEVPEGFRVTGWSDDKVVASFESSDGRIVGTQFHPEVSETKNGADMIIRFLTETAAIEPDPNYTLEVALNDYMEKQEAEIAEILEKGDMIAGFLSGGVDSMTAASAVMKVARQLNRLEQVRFFYVDNGHTRYEDDGIIEKMRDSGMPVDKIDARTEFFHSRLEVTPKGQDTRLAGPLVEEFDPAVKRSIIGAVFNRIARRLMDDLSSQTSKKVYLMQGTNNSDIVESGGRGGDQIKGHHNIEEMETMRQAKELLEPLAGLMKYHVRLLAEKRYGLSEAFAFRQPFPGVGFSPRIIVNLNGELGSFESGLQDQVDQITSEVVGDQPIEAHVVGTIKTVGQQGDSRSFGSSVFIEGTPDWQLLSRLARQIVNRTPGLNRVFYLPSLNVDRSAIQGVVTRDEETFTDQLKIMEEVHRRAMSTSGLDPFVSQHFVGTLGVDFTGLGMPTLGLRLFITGNNLDKQALRRHGDARETFRTGVAALAGVHIDESAFSYLIRTLKNNLRYHSSIAYDLTDKPPGSTEWE